MKSACVSLAFCRALGVALLVGLTIGCATRPPCSESEAFTAGRDAAKVGEEPRPETVCSEYQSAYQRGFSVAAIGRCDAGARWQAAVSGEAVDTNPWCDRHGGPTWRQSATLGTQYFQMRTRFAALAGSEVATEILERQRLEGELNALRGIAALRGWELPEDPD